MLFSITSRLGAALIGSHYNRKRGEREAAIRHVTEVLNERYGFPCHFSYHQKYKITPQRVRIEFPYTQHRLKPNFWEGFLKK